MSATVTAAQDLQPKIRAAYIWTVSGNLLKTLFGTVISVLLARFLRPEDYGLLGMVTVFVAIASSIQDLGLGQAVVHFNEDTSAIPTYFTTTGMLGLGLTALVFAAAPVVAAFYHEPRLIAIIQVLSVTLLISSLQAVSTGILSKQFHFRRLMLIEMSATWSAGVIGVVMAWRGFGVWSLVTNLVLGCSLQNVMLWWSAPPHFTLHVRRDLFPRLLRYGLPLTAASVLHQVYDNADYLVVGKLAGAAALGYYTLAFRLATLAHEKIAAVVNRVAFPSFAAMQKDLTGLVEHWFAISQTVAFINFPLLALLGMNAPDVLHCIFGAKWQPAAAPLRLLCLIGVLRSLVHIVLHVFSALGRTDLRLTFGIVNLLVMPAAFVVGCKLDGITGVGIAWCVTYPFILVMVLAQVRTIVPLSWKGYFINLAPPAAVTLASMAMMAPVDLLFPHLGWTRLAVRSAVGVLTVAGCFYGVKPVRQRVGTLIGTALRRTAA